MEAISYSNFGTAGQYQQVTNMQGGQCDFQPASYGGGMAPFNDEVSWHFRGPIQLKQFAFYSLGSSSSKTKRSQDQHHHRSQHVGRYAAHRHFHQLKQEIAANVAAKAKRDDGSNWTSWKKLWTGGSPQPGSDTDPVGGNDATPSGPSDGVGPGSDDGPSTRTWTEIVFDTVWVTATIDGQVTSWPNTYPGPGATSGFATSVISSAQSSTDAATSVVPTTPISTTTSLPSSSEATSDGGHSSSSTSQETTSTSSPASSTEATTTATVTTTSDNSPSSSTTSTTSTTTTSPPMIPTPSSSSYPTTLSPSTTTSSEVIPTSSPTATSSEVFPTSSTSSLPSSSSSAGISSSSTSIPSFPSSSSSAEVSSSSTSESSFPTSSSTTTSSASTSSPTNGGGGGSGTWTRQAYYDAESGTASGLVFLNHFGGTGSGVFDYTWGNSLSYSNADATSASSGPVTLADTLVGDNQEFVIMTDNECTAENEAGCDYYRPGSVAYHGFGGASKLFLAEFQMPLSGKTGFNADMPAAWMLNAQVPRTQQYGSCSCWQSGCGEFDILEVLNSGNTKCKSTWHGAHSLGSSNWFARPTDKTVKVAVILDGTGSTGTASIVILDDSVSFGDSVDPTSVSGWMSTLSSSEKLETALPSK
ncbi:target of Sbf [Exophiala oligosperma]